MTAVSSGAWTNAAQIELFGVAAATDDRTATCAPCPRCRTTVAIVGPGVGPHYRSLRCLRGHFLAWLPGPRRR